MKLTKKQLTDLILEASGFDLSAEVRRAVNTSAKAMKDLDRAVEDNVNDADTTVDLFAAIDQVNNALNKLRSLVGEGGEASEAGGKSVLQHGRRFGHSG